MSLLTGLLDLLAAIILEIQMSLLALLVTVIIIGLAFWAIRALLGAFSVGEPISTVVYVIIVVIVVLWLLQILGGGAGNIGHFRL